MSLPKGVKPKYDVDLPMSKRTVTFSPFTGHEEKVLKMAEKQNGNGQKRHAFLDVMRSTVQDFDDVLQTCPLGDVELLFVHTVARSVNDKLHLTYRCRCAEGGSEIPVVFNLLDTEVKASDGFKSVEKFTVETDEGEFVLEMSSPTGDDVFGEETSLKKMVSKLYSTDGETVYDMDDVTEEEINEFFDSLILPMRRPILNWMKNIPTISNTSIAKCKKCGKQQTVTIRGINDFFPSPLGEKA